MLLSKLTSVHKIFNSIINLNPGGGGGGGAIRPKSSPGGGGGGGAIRP